MLPYYDMYKTPQRIFLAGTKKKTAIQRHPTIMTDYYYDYIQDEIERREKIEFEMNVSVNSDEEQY